MKIIHRIPIILVASSTLFSNGLPDIGSIGSSVTGSIDQTLQNALQKAKQEIENATQKVESTVSSVTSTVETDAQKTVQQALSGLKNIKSGAITFAGKEFTQLGNLVVAVGNEFKECGTVIKNSAEYGASQLDSRIQSALLQVAQEGINTAEDALAAARTTGSAGINLAGQTISMTDTLWADLANATLNIQEISINIDLSKVDNSVAHVTGTLANKPFDIVITLEDTDHLTDAILAGALKTVSTT